MLAAALSQYRRVLMILAAHPDLPAHGATALHTQVEAEDASAAVAIMLAHRPVLNEKIRTDLAQSPLVQVARPALARTTNTALLEHLSCTAVPSLHPGLAANPETPVEFLVTSLTKSAPSSATFRAALANPSTPDDVVEVALSRPEASTDLLPSNTYDRIRLVSDVAAAHPDVVSAWWTSYLPDDVLRPLAGAPTITPAFAEQLGRLPYRCPARILAANPWVPPGVVPARSLHVRRALEDTLEETTPATALAAGRGVALAAFGSQSLDTWLSHQDVPEQVLQMLVARPKPLVHPHTWARVAHRIRPDQLAVWVAGPQLGKSRTSALTTSAPLLSVLHSASGAPGGIPDVAPAFSLDAAQWKLLLFLLARHEEPFGVVVEIAKGILA